MTYAFYESSVDWGSPIECFRFTGPNETYLYTSHDTPVTILAETFQPVAAERGATRVVSDSESNTSFELTIDSNAKIVRDYIYSLVAPNSLLVEIFRVHDGSNFDTDHVKIWKGFLSTIDVSAEMARLTIPSLFSRAMQNECPNISFQNPCNHVLYDEKCRVSRAQYIMTAIVQQVAGSVLRVDSTLFGLNDLAGGEIQCTRTGERRTVHANQDDAVQISYPFSDLQIGDEVSVSQGCDHSFETCKTKFSNSLNYGGFPSIPVDNPFEGEL